MYKYVIRANGLKALAVHSDLDLNEMIEYVRVNSKKLHKDSTDTVFSWGTVELVNPQVLMPSEYVDFCPALLWVI